MAYSTDRSTTLNPMWTQAPAGEAFHHVIRYDASQLNLGAALHKITTIPAGTFIQGVVVECETAEGGTATVDIGDHTDADTAVDIDGWIDGANLNSASTATSTGQAATTEEYTGGKFYVASKDLTMTVNNALDAAIFKITIFGRRFRDNPTFTITE